MFLWLKCANSPTHKNLKLTRNFKSKLHTTVEFVKRILVTFRFLFLFLPSQNSQLFISFPELLRTIILLSLTNRPDLIETVSKMGLYCSGAVVLSLLPIKSCTLVNSESVADVDIIVSRSSTKSNSALLIFSFQWPFCFSLSYQPFSKYCASFPPVL